MSLVSLTITGSFRNPDTLTPLTGQVVLRTKPGRLVSPGERVQLGGKVTAVIDDQGLISATMVRPAAGLLPEGWLCEIDEQLDDADRDVYTVLLPMDVASVDLTELTRVFTGAVDDYTVVVGPAGVSAYEQWLAAGHTGTEDDFLASLVGPKGDTGATPALGAAGAGAGIALRSTDPTTTNSRTPVAHHASHAVGGSDPLTPADIGLGNVSNTADSAKPVSTAQATALAAKADLVGGLVPTSQLPAIAITDTFTVASQAAMLALVAQRGDLAIRSDFTPARVYVLAADTPTVLSAWVQISFGAIQSVNGQTGLVNLGAADVSADPAGAATTAVSTHAGAADPHGDRADAASKYVPLTRVPDVQVFTATNTWTKPAGAQTVVVHLLGGGGGGGSGRRGAAGAVRCGGGGGAGGSAWQATLQASLLPATVTVTVGAGGAGGPARTTDLTDGATGTTAGATSFGTYARVGVAQGGGGGTATTGTAGPTGSGSTVGGTGGAASTTGGTGGAGAPGVLAAPGGGAGGGITTGNAAGAGGVGGSSAASLFGTGGTPDTTTPTSPPDTAAGSGLVGGGGGGGAASITTTAQDGAAGARYGAGGGGGGASVNGANSGAGGAGAPGIAIVYSYF